MTETPSSILDFWFADTLDNPASVGPRMKTWFGGGPDADRKIAARFKDTLAQLAAGEASGWATKGPRERLAAVIALDQFSRSIFRNSPASFANDPLARALTREAIASGEDRKLRPLERWFLYMPLEHSEALADQQLSVQKFTELKSEGPAALQSQLAIALDYAHRHVDVIKQYTRFPHRNALLGRKTTPEEADFLKKNPGGF